MHTRASCVPFSHLLGYSPQSYPPVITPQSYPLNPTEAALVMVLHFTVQFYAYIFETVERRFEPKLPLSAGLAMDPRKGEGGCFYFRVADLVL